MTENPQPPVELKPQEQRELAVFHPLDAGWVPPKEPFDWEEICDEWLKQAAEDNKHEVDSLGCREVGC